MNMIADRVIQKYQKASCEDLWKQKRKQKTDEEKNLAPSGAHNGRTAKRQWDRRQGSAGLDVE